MREIVIGGRSATVTHLDTKTTAHGDIQRYRIDVSGSDVSTQLSSLRTSPDVDARVMISAIDAELILEYEGSAESALLRDPAIRAWRDQNRQAIEDVLVRLRDEVAKLAPEPVSDIERMLHRAFGVGEEDDRA
ncbi:hypothetical protein [Rathayibacter sp. AY1D5]|uniref:hypothetical protein n=1 Tax=Rathayibacter sp. AY1D5 TaxID=2080546 RepID=UPI000CE78C2B|nr:hypothetical protein [Rathayibacter sp. AY1D5]PPH89829.1 hypothetical protein C5C82_07170 [Rathayibacter sp. AY1D5]